VRKDLGDMDCQAATAEAEDFPLTLQFAAAAERTSGSDTRPELWDDGKTSIELNRQGALRSSSRAEKQP
jgi:hypothetical protein